MRVECNGKRRAEYVEAVRAYERMGDAIWVECTGQPWGVIEDEGNHKYRVEVIESLMYRGLNERERGDIDGSG